MMAQSGAFTIGLHSEQEKLRAVFRSIIRVLNQVVGLQHDWAYCEEPELDVHIVDLDDPQAPQQIDRLKHCVVIATSAHEEQLAGWTYALLSKPLRSQALLQIMQQIERKELSSLRGQNKPASAIQPLPAQSSLQDHPAGATSATYSLQNWPDLPQIPEEHMFEAARVCALLAVQPATLQQISQLLNLAMADLEALLALIRQCGHQGYPVLAMDHSPQGLTVPAIEVPVQAQPSSFLAKIWNRLKGAA